MGMQTPSAQHASLEKAVQIEVHQLLPYDLGFAECLPRPCIPLVRNSQTACMGPFGTTETYHHGAGIWQAGERGRHWAICRATSS